MHSHGRRKARAAQAHCDGLLTYHLCRRRRRPSRQPRLRSRLLCSRARRGPQRLRAQPHACLTRSISCARGSVSPQVPGGRQPQTSVCNTGQPAPERSPPRAPFLPPRVSEDCEVGETEAHTCFFFFAKFRQSEGRREEGVASRKEEDKSRFVDTNNFRHLSSEHAPLPSVGSFCQVVSRTCSLGSFI